jgi:ubiquitin C-terminal hydrolase
MADNLQNQLIYARKQKAFAWAKYYETTNQRLNADYNNYQRINNTIAKDVAIPTHIVEEFKNMAKEIRKTWDCPICLEMIAPDQLEITNCGHYYCKPCLEALKKDHKDKGDDKWKCGMCNRKHKLAE